MKSDDAFLQDQIERLNRIGIALTLEHDLRTLLELIVSEARGLARADGGSLYLVQGDRLHFAVAQNDTLEKRLGSPLAVRELFQHSDLPISRKSLAGYVAATGQIVNIKDVYRLPSNAEFSFSPRFDIINQYRTQSMLSVPMKNREGEVAGVLCLVNAMDRQGNVVPFDKRCESLLVSIASQAMAAIENTKLIERLKAAYLDTIFCLSMAAEARDRETGAHVRRISEYCAILGARLGLHDEEVETLRYASPLHDVGKIGIPDRILQKPEKLTEAEYEMMKNHTVIGARILKGESEYLAMARLIALTHHEWYDGTGYPRSLSGENIPLPGRITAVADVFDALVSKRVYKDGIPAEQARAAMEKEVGRHFCPTVFDAFDTSLPDFLEVLERFRDEEESSVADITAHPFTPDDILKSD